MVSKIFGSSSYSGEGIFDFEEEVFGVSVSVCHAFDDLDLVVDAFEDAGIEGEPSGGEDPPEVGFELAGEGDQRL